LFSILFVGNLQAAEPARVGAMSGRASGRAMPAIRAGSAAVAASAPSAPVAPVAAVAAAPIAEPEPEIDDEEEIEEVEVVEAAPAKTETKTAAKAEPAAEVAAAIAVATPVVENADACRDEYNDCMDQFCLLDESEGERCACSDNIDRSKTMIRKINSTQAEAEKLYSEGVEKEKLGAKAVLVFGGSDKAKNSRIDLNAWLNAGTGDEEDDGLDDDYEIGDALYKMAGKSCADRLAKCGKDGDMVKLLYTRSVTADCKTFTTFLGQQQKVADNNKAAAEKAVRAARFAELENTNKYNRGECLIAMRACVAEKGGCGENFENCLDKGLLTRRTNACENITDQCMAVKKDVMKDWDDEMKSILADAAKYADKYKRNTCLARTEACLEDKCSTASNDACLNNVEVAAGICTEINECEEIIPGFKGVVNDKLAYLRVRFCQNDLESCFQDKCGADYTKPECLGKPVHELAKLCPADFYPSCKGQKQFDVLVSSIFLQLDYAIMQGCINKFSEDLGRVCGPDMSCIADDPAISALTNTEEARKLFEPQKNEEGESTGILGWKAYADQEVDKLFSQLENDATIGACADTQNPKIKVKGKQGVGRSVFNTAKLIGKVNAEQRQYRALVSKMRELAKKEDVAEAKAACELFGEDDKIDSVSFEPALRNCHVCRTQEVCEEGGESAMTGALKAGAGGLAAGAAAGTMVSPGWGTAIGGVVGGLGAGIMGGLSSKEQKFCQEIQSCEDINM
jgi:hypothetical protein